MHWLANSYTYDLSFLPTASTAASVHILDNDNWCEGFTKVMSLFIQLLVTVVGCVPANLNTKFYKFVSNPATMKGFSGVECQSICWFISMEELLLFLPLTDPSAYWKLGVISSSGNNNLLWRGLGLYLSPQTGPTILDEWRINCLV